LVYSFSRTAKLTTRDQKTNFFAENQPHYLAEFP
jgi:hypothetical protein